MKIKYYLYLLLKTNLLYQLFNVFFNLYIRKSIKHIFIFPFFQTGGGERVHLDIVKLFPSKTSLTIFTNNSENKHFKKDFEKSCYIFEYNFLNEKLQKFFINMICRFLNIQKRKLTVFGCNNKVFYNILPLVENPNIFRVDLLHAFTKPGVGAEDTSLPYIQYLDRRVVINKKTRCDFQSQYSRNNIPDHYLKRIVQIQNAVKMPIKFKRNSNPKLHVCFVGRNSPEKRQHLFFDIAEELNERFKFYSAGSDFANNFVENVGVLETQEELSSFYRSMDILLITSSREGFPMVIMEAMAFGVVCITTNVGGINEHLKNGLNGLLIENSVIEREIVDEFIKQLYTLSNDRELLKQLSVKSFEYAYENFNDKKFKESYLELLSNA